MNFKAFDTETVNRPGRGEACLLVKMGKAGPEFFEFPRTFGDIFEFLAGGKWLAWNMDFDARAICHDQFLSFETLENLAIFGKAQEGPWRFSYIPAKSLAVTSNDGRRFEIYDLAQFFGLSLKAASEKYLPSDLAKRDIPKSWYSKMDACLRDNRRGRILNYAARDVEAAQALADMLLGSMSKIGLNPRRLSSCAGLARLKFGKVMSEVRPPDYVNRIFEKSFFGGRIETRVLGKVGPCKLYDIHSAYPSIIAALPDPRGRVVISSSNWKFNSGVSYGCYEIRVSVPLSWAWGPLAVRKGSRVVYPVGVFKTTCGLPAIKVLRARGVDFSVISAYEIHSLSPSPIFEGIEALYLERKNSAVSLAVKTVLNSIYGVLAERRNYYSETALEPGSREIAGRFIRSRTGYGRLTNMILAAHITESVRMKIWEVLHELQDKAFFCATDGILVDHGSSVKCADSIGAWGSKGGYSHAVVLGCGRYILGGEIPEYHLRGFPVKTESFEKLRNCKRARASIKVLSGSSLKQWAASPRADLNVLVETRKDLTIADDKRLWLERFKKISQAWTSQIESLPLMGDILQGVTP